MNLLVNKLYLAWEGLWDIIHALHKYVLMLQMVWFFFHVMIYVMKMLITYDFALYLKLFFKLVNDVHSTKISLLEYFHDFVHEKSYLVHFFTNPYFPYIFPHV